MGFDLDRSEADGSNATSADNSVFSHALSRNLLAERFAIDAHHKLAEGGQNYDRATLRLVKVALAVEEEHAEILSAIIENLRNLNGALAG
jgi:bacterioferritin (cytochrome b1)